MTTATQTQLRRDTAANLAAATPAVGEIGIDTTNKRPVVGDGSTAGGIPVPNYLDIQTQKYVYATTGGTGDVITLTSTKAIAAYGNGGKVVFKAGANNTGPVTANQDAKGARNVKKLIDGVLTALVADDITSGGVYELYDDGTQFQIKGLNEKTSSDGAMIYLATFTASGSSSIDITSTLSATYDDYVIVLNAVRPATDSSTLRLRTSSDNSTFDSGALNYKWAGSSIVGTSQAIDGSTSDTAITVSSLIGNAAAYTLSGEIRLYSVNDATAYKKIVNEVVHIDSTGANAKVSGGGHRLSTSIVNAVRFFMSSGNITSGTFKVYGIAKA